MLVTRPPSSSGRLKYLGAGFSETASSSKRRFHDIGSLLLAAESYAPPVKRMVPLTLQSGNDVKAPFRLLLLKLRQSWTLVARSVYSVRFKQLTDNIVSILVLQREAPMLLRRAHRCHPGPFFGAQYLKPGYTYDGRTNGMIGGALQGRLDRFWCRLQDFDAESIEMVGTEPIPGLRCDREFKNGEGFRRASLPVFPSDHYGLLLKIRRRRGNLIMGRQEQTSGKEIVLVS